jgi:hypothetical protein
VTLEDAIAAANAPDALNPLFALLHARSKPCPAKTWWYAEALHPAIFRALKMDRAEQGAVFASLPFRLDRSNGEPRILVAFPCPRILAPHDNDDWLEIETVLSWDPRADTAEIADDPGPNLAGNIPPDTESLDIYNSPFAFFRALAEARARWFVARQMIAGDWRQKPREPDLSPGLLLIGKPDQVRWPLHRMPADLTCHGVDAKALNRALLKQARVPRAHAGKAEA